MRHLTEEELADRLRPGPVAGHLAGCQSCRDRAAALAQLAAASRVLADEEMAGVSVPPFERLRAALPPRPAPVAVSERRAGWRLAVALVAAQLRLLPGLLLPASAAGFAAAVALAGALPSGRAGQQLFGAAVALIVLVGALSVSSRRRDPRTELLFTLPVSPVAVLGARLFAVLGTDFALALAGSGVLAATGRVGGLDVTVTSWFGQALLTAGVALVFSVGRAGMLGPLLGGLTWLVGSAATLPGAPNVPLQGLAVQMWSTSPGVLVVALVLLAIALLRVRTPRVAAAEGA